MQKSIEGSNGCRYKLGDDPDAMVSFKAMGIPEPTQAISAPYQEAVLRGDLTMQSSGYRTIKLAWETLWESQLRALVRRIFSSESDLDAGIYLTAPIRNGWWSGDNDFRTYYCKALRPNLSGEQEGGPAEKTHTVYQGVTFTFIIDHEVTTIASFS